MSMYERKILRIPWFFVVNADHMIAEKTAAGIVADTTSACT